MRNRLLYVLAALLLVGLSVFFYFSPKPTTIKGAVVAHSEVAGQWGIRPKGILFSRDIVYVHELPTSLQKEGLSVKCGYKDNIRDVIGMGDWGVVIDASDCRLTDSSNVDTLEDEWRTYTNDILGFSLDIPRKIFPTYCPEQGVTDLLVIESETDSIHFGYRCGENIRVVSGWNIKIFNNIASNQEISSVFREVYYKNCEIDLNFVPDTQGNVEIRAANFEEPVSPDSCFINYATHFKYNPQFKKIATWNIGHEANFWKDNGGVGYDEAMTESFRFLGNLEDQGPHTMTDVANWQTYEYDDAGFSIKYPPGWRIDIDRDGALYVITSLGLEHRQLQISIVDYVAEKQESVLQDILIGGVRPLKVSDREIVVVANGKTYYLYADTFSDQDISSIVQTLTFIK